MTSVREIILADNIEALTAALDNGYPPEIEIDGTTSLLQFAVQARAFGCCSVLIRYGADVRKTDTQGRTLLHLLMESWHGEDADRTASLLSQLYVAGLDMRRTDFFGRTPYDILKQKGEYAELLMPVLKESEKEPGVEDQEFGLEVVQVRLLGDAQDTAVEDCRPRRAIMLRFSGTNPD